jgi:hypothetical protein
LVRKLLKRVRCPSVADLKTRLLAFIDSFNATMAKPFKWTYGKKPLAAYQGTHFSRAVLGGAAPLQLAHKGHKVGLFLSGEV